jgi:hypothetical protein
LSGHGKKVVALRRIYLTQVGSQTALGRAQDGIELVSLWAVVGVQVLVTAEENLNEVVVLVMASVRPAQESSEKEIVNERGYQWRPMVRRDSTSDY